MNKFIIAGGRDFKDYELMRQKLDLIFNAFPPDEIISGGQKTIDENTGDEYGADFLGECYAIQHNIPLRIFKADWEKHGRAAGPIRNREMADYGTALIAFWDGKSKGTKNMIEEARKKHIKDVIIIRY